MIRSFILILSIAATIQAAPLELVFVNKGELTRVELSSNIDGKSLESIRDETFARIFAYYDRDSNGWLDTKEVALLPSVRALRQAMANGFTPPIGNSPSFAVLDRDGDGKVTLVELANYYRTNGIGSATIGVGRLPASADLAEALLKQLDTNRDGKVDEREWKAAVETLKSLDKNDDELIGAGELLPKTVYPGAAGTTLLAPPTANANELLAKYPFIVLPADDKDVYWVDELVRRSNKLKRDALMEWRKNKPDAGWQIQAMKNANSAECRDLTTKNNLRIECWTTSGKLGDSVAASRKAIGDLFENPSKESGERPNRRARGDLAWLTPIADRNGDGKLSRSELDAWLELQSHIAKGQVLLTILDGGGLFELLDKNHDGALSIRELRSAWDRLRAAGCIVDGVYDLKKQPSVILIAASLGYPNAIAIDARAGSSWFRAMDKNGDGDVSRREFTGPAEVFDRLDLDRDGLLSAAEADRVSKR